MKETGLCPRCKGHRFYIIEEATIPDPRYANSFEPLTLAGALLPTGEQGFLGDKLEKCLVSLEAWVCAGCGYTDLYARDLESLSRMATAGKANVHFVERQAKAPFR